MSKETDETSNESQEFNEEQHNQEMIQKVEDLENEVNPTTEEQEDDTSTDEDEETGEEATEEESSEDESSDDQEESDEEQSDDEAADEAVEEAGLNMEDLQAEYDENGQLSPESYLALERAGIPRSTVDNYISGLEAQAELIEMKAYDAVGGKDNYQAITQWASDNLNEDEISAFNESLSNPTGAQFKLALEGLQARYVAANGSMTDNLGGQGRGTVDVFESLDQVRVAMSDPRYATDTAYQRQVAAKLQRSKII